MEGVFVDTTVETNNLEDTTDSVHIFADELNATDGLTGIKYSFDTEASLKEFLETDEVQSPFLALAVPASNTHRWTLIGMILITRAALFFGERHTYSRHIRSCWPP